MCEEPPSVPNADLHAPSRFFADVIVYTCKEGK